MLTFCITCVFFILIEMNAAKYNSDNPVIKFEFSKSTLDEKRKYTVVKKKPLIIILKNYYPVSVRCQSYYVVDLKYEKFVTKDFTRIEPDGMITVENISDSMSTQWRCSIFRNYTGGLPSWTNQDGIKHSQINVDFKIHVKGAKKVSFSVNGWIFEPDISVQPATKFDGEIFYEYLDGDLILLTCNTSIGDKLLKYYDAQGTLILQTDEMYDSPTFRSVLTARNNYSYMECECNNKEPFDTYYYRIIFVLTYLDPKYDYPINISVNGIKLAPRISNIEKTKQRCYDYYYEYGFESILNVICRNNNSNSGKIGLEIGRNSVLAESMATEQSGTMQKELSTQYLNNKILICEYTNTDGSVVTARLKFKIGFQGTVARILGFPERKLEYQFTRNESFYSMSYRYLHNERAELRCVVSDSPNIEYIEWTYQNKNITFSPEKIYTFGAFDVRIKPLRLTLSADQNATSIQCNAFDRYGLTNYTVDVFLNLDPGSLVISSDPTIHTTDDEDQSLIIIGGSIAVTVVTITVICALCWCTRGRKKINEENYENLSNNSTIPAHPSQWENYYSEPDEVVPSVRQNEIPTEAHYTEINYLSINQLSDNTQGCELRPNDTNYENLQHRQSNEISCNINSTNDISFRFRNNVESRFFPGVNIHVTCKNNSIYNISTDSQSSRCAVLKNDDYEK